MDASVGVTPTVKWMSAHTDSWICEDAATKQDVIWNCP